MEAAVQSEDAALVAAIARGDQSALQTLYERYSSLMLAIGLRVIGVRREAEDLLHDVFLEAWKKAADYDPDRGAVRTWLTLRMRSRALDRVRSARISRSVPLEVGFPEHRSLPGDDDPSRGVDRTRIREALAELPEDSRQILLLGYFEGLSSSEVAERLGIPLGTVKSRVAGAKKKMRESLESRSRGKA